MPKSAQRIDVSAMRDLGRSLKEQGFFEVDLETGRFLWANDFALDQYGFRLDQLQSMSLWDLVPEEFHEDIRNSVADQVHGKLFRFSIRPSLAADDRLVWWYIVRVRADHPIYWFRGEYLNTTDKKGPEFSSMCAAMTTANGYNELYNELADFKGWTRENLSRLEGADEEIKEDVRELKDQLQAAIKASHRAANAALESKASIEAFKRDVSDQMSRQTAEIIKLISNDALQGEQLKRFEAFMEQTTETAVQTVKKTMQQTTETAVKTISDQTERSGDKITRKVTVPIGVIAGIVTIIQWLIQHYR